MKTITVLLMIILAAGAYILLANGSESRDNGALKESEKVGQTEYTK